MCILNSRQLANEQGNEETKFKKYKSEPKGRQTQSKKNQKLIHILKNICLDSYFKFFQTR